MTGPHLQQRSRHIIIVEDEPDLREEIGEMFECRGFTVATAGDAGGAMYLLRRTTDMVCLLTDFRLPGASGLDLVRWIRNEPAIDAKVQRIAIMTGHSELTDLVDAELARNRVRMLSKPVASAVLMALFDGADTPIAPATAA